MHIFNQVSIREEKRWQERRRRLALLDAVIRNRTLMRIITLSLVNKEKNIRPPPPPFLPAAHSLGKRATKEMRSAKFLIKGGEQRDGEGGKEAGGGRNERRSRFGAAAGGGDSPR